MKSERSMPLPSQPHGMGLLVLRFLRFRRKSASLNIANSICRTTFRGTDFSLQWATQTAFTSLVLSSASARLSITRDGPSCTVVACIPNEQDHFLCHRSMRGGPRSSYASCCGIESFTSLFADWNRTNARTTLSLLWFGKFPLLFHLGNDDFWYISDFA